MTPEPLERMDRIERVEKWLTALAPLGPVRLHYHCLLYTSPSPRDS